MAQESSRPWVGKHYDETKLLLLADPDNLSDHPTEMVRKVLDGIKGASNMSFMKKLSQGLAGDKDPRKERLHHVWHRVAFTYYVGETKSDFCSNILNKLRPRRIIVLGKSMWSHEMPDAVHMTDDVQGYSLEDGSVAVCFALDHPAKLTWTRLADTIHFALGRELPRSGPYRRFPGDGE